MDIRKKFVKSVEALEQVAQRGGGCSITGDVQDQTGQSSEQPDLAVGVPVYCRGAGIHDLQRSLSTQMILQFYELQLFNGLTKT